MYVTLISQQQSAYIMLSVYAEMLITICCTLPYVAVIGGNKLISYLVIVDFHRTLMLVSIITIGGSKTVQLPIIWLVCYLT